MTTQNTLVQRHTGDYSLPERLPDPPREPDMLQEESLYQFRGTLTPHYADRDDVLVSGAGYLRRAARDPGELAPDGVVALGVSDPRAIIARNGYVISEVGKPPDFVLEVASRSAGRRDYTLKRAGYAEYGTREYWRFDPTGGEYHDAPIAGDALVDGEYVPIEIASESDTRHCGYSEVLGLELWWDEGFLRFRDPVSGEFLPTPEESRSARLLAEGRAESERVARMSAEERVAELEAELRGLRGG